MSSEDQAAELFGGESSSGDEEEDDSSEESSGEPENEREEQQQGEVVGAEGSREGREGDGGGGEEDSSSSGESGSASETEENEEISGGVASVSSPWKQDQPSEAEPGDNAAAGGSDALSKAQSLFGEASSSSSSDSEDGGADVIGVGGGSDSEGEEGVNGSPSGGVKSPSTSQGEEGVADGITTGNETMESEDGAGQSEDGPSQTVEGLFGDAADLSSSDSDDGEEGREEEGERSEVVKELEKDVGEAETEVPRINVEIPRCTATLGTDLYFVKLPNFLSVETRPFDPALYEDEAEDESEILDEEGRARLKLKVENTIRWRYSQDESGNEVRESNARVVRWSDGTMSLYLGSEIFDIHRHPLQGEFSHLFVRQGTGLQGQAVFQSKLTFRPHSTDSQTHRKMTLSIADRFSKAQKIRVLPAVGLDPESQKKEKIKKEEERLRAAVRRENQQKRIRERNSQRGLTANYIEPDREDDDDDEGASVAAIKSSVKHRLSEARGGRGGRVWGGAESEEESSGEEGVERLIRAKRDEGDSRKRHLDLPEVDVTRKKQPRRLQSDDSEESD